MPIFESDERGELSLREAERLAPLPDKLAESSYVGHGLNLVINCNSIFS